MHLPKTRMAGEHYDVVCNSKQLKTACTRQDRLQCIHGGTQQSCEEDRHTSRKRCYMKKARCRALRTGYPCLVRERRKQDYMLLFPCTEEKEQECQQTNSKWWPASGGDGVGRQTRRGGDNSRRSSSHGFEFWKCINYLKKFNEKFLKRNSKKHCVDPHLRGNTLWGLYAYGRVPLSWRQDGHLI